MSRSSALRLVAATLCVAVTVISAAAGSAAAPNGRDTVDVSGTTFNPDPLNDVLVGGRVVWKFLDGPHTVTADGDPPLFDSRTMRAGEEYAFTFKDPGTYTYRCQVHQDQGMVGTINVIEPAPETTTTTTTAATTTTTAGPVATTTTTTSPATTPTTEPPTTSTTQPVASAVGATTSTTVAAPPAAPPPPGPSTAAGSPKKKGSGSSTTTTAKAPDQTDKADGEAAAPDPAAPPVEGLTLASLADGSAPAEGEAVPAAEESDDEIVVAPAVNEDGNPGGGAGPLVALVLGVALLVLGGAGYAWYHRSSRYFPA